MFILRAIGHSLMWLMKITEIYNIIIHEFGHAWTCLILGGKLESINFEFIPKGCEYTYLGIVFKHEDMYRGSASLEIPQQLWKAILILVAGVAFQLISVFVLLAITIAFMRELNLYGYAIVGTIFALNLICCCSWIPKDLNWNRPRSDGRYLRYAFQSKTGAELDSKIKTHIQMLETFGFDLS